MNPKYKETEGTLIGEFRRLNADIADNRDFLTSLPDDDIPNAEQDYVIVHELLYFSVPNHGKLWKSLMRAHIGEYEQFEARMKKAAKPTEPRSSSR